MRKRPSIFARMFGGSNARTEAQAPDLSRSVDAQIDNFWNWQRAGCPYSDTPSKEMGYLIEACTSSDHIRLGALAAHPSEWVRLGVACNPHTPVWALWGDALASFGLAEDESVWVSASVRLRHFKPPVEIVESLRASRKLGLVGLVA